MLSSNLLSDLTEIFGCQDEYAHKLFFHKNQKIDEFRADLDHWVLSPNSLDALGCDALLRRYEPKVGHKCLQLSSEV